PLPSELDGTAIIERPSSHHDAATANTVCPPGPLYTRPFSVSAVTWPVRSICNALLMATKLSSCTSVRRLSVWQKTHSSNLGFMSAAASSSRGSAANAEPMTFPRRDLLAPAGHHALGNE